MGVKVKYSYEIMDNYKNVSLAAGDKKMQALCEKGINSLFSIGDNGIFYLTMQVTSDEAGWKRYNLMHEIQTLYKGKAVLAKTFAGVKSKDTNQYIIALVVTVENKDYLYISSEARLGEPVWKLVPFDDASIKNAMQIKEVYLSLTGNKVYTIVDIAEKTTQTVNPIKRYFIDLESTLNKGKWVHHPLPVDLEEIRTSCMGRGYKEAVDGIYTLGDILGHKEIIYTPVYNYFNPEIPPTSIRFNTEQSIECIQSMKIGNNTHLFACGGGGLYVYPYAEQKDGAHPYKLIEDERLTQVKQLYAYKLGEKTYVWGFNENGDLFHMFCQSENISDGNNWSVVLPVLKGVQYAYPYKNPDFNSNCLISYGKDGTLIVGEEAPDTGLLSNANVTLPATDEKPIKFTTYTTRITVTDQDDMILPNKKIFIQSETPCNVYINGMYYALRDYPCEVDTDTTGKLLIFHKTDTINAHNFIIWADEGQMITITPSEKSSKKLLSLNEKNKLKNAKLPNGESLVPKDIRDEDIEAIAHGIDLLGDVALTLPSSSMKLKGSMSKANFLANTNHKGSLLLCVRPEGIESYTGEAALRQMSPTALKSLQSVDGLVDDIIYTAGDIFSWIKDLGKSIYNIFITFVEDTWHFVLEIGGKIYQFVITCINEIVACCETFFELIKVGIEKLIDFVKFLFSWDDIVRVKDVSKKCVQLTITYVNNYLLLAKEKTHEMITELISKIDEWADIETVNDVMNKPVLELKDSDSGRENTDVTDMFLTDHFVDNYPSSTLHESLFKQAMASDPIKEAFEIFARTVEEQEDILKELIDKLRRELFENENFSSYSLLTIIKKILAILATAGFETCDNMVAALIDVIVLIIKTVADIMDKPIYIPVFSEILEDLFNVPPVSLLDILCLLPSIGSCIIYKMCTGKAPFERESYDAWMALEKFEDIKKLKHTSSSAEEEGLQSIKTSLSEKEGYIIFHALAGVVALHETLIHPFETASGEAFPLVGDIFSVLEVGVCLGAHFMFEPSEIPEDTLGLVVFIEMIKYGSDLGKVACNNPTEKSFKEFFKLTYMLGSAFELIYYTGSICYVAINEKDGEKSTLSIMNSSSMIVDDIKNIVDYANSYVEEPITKAILEGVRSIMALGYDSLQIALGIMGSNMLETN